MHVERSWGRWAAAGILVLVPALLVLPGLRSGHFLFGMDFVSDYYSIRGFIGKELAAGRLPVWDPYTMCGSPLLASLHPGVLYPLTWPCAVLSPGASWTFTVLVHLVLLGLFADAWLRRGLGLDRWPSVGGALVLMLSGFVVLRIYGGHVANFSAIPWAAAILWRLERFLAGPSLRRSFLLAGAFALLLLSGAAPFFMMAGIAAFARLAVHVAESRDGRKGRTRTAALAAASLALGPVLAAPQLLPTYEYVRHGHRAAVASWDFVTNYSLPPENLLTLLVPALFGDGRDTDYWGRWHLWEMSGFVGVSALALAALGAAGRRPQRLLWIGLALSGLLLALGRHTPVFSVFYHVVPGAGLFRAPVRYLLLFVLSMGPLVAMGFQRLAAPDASLKRHATGIAGVAAALLLLAAGAALSLRGPEPGWWTSLTARERTAIRAELSQDRVVPANARETAAAGLAWAAACLAAVAGTLLAQRGTPPLARGAALALGALLLGELAVHGERYFVAWPRDQMEMPAEFVSNVRAHPRWPFRIATVSSDQEDLIGKCRLAEIDHLGGYDPMMIRQYTELMNVSAGKPPAELTVLLSALRSGPITDLLGARYWIVPGPKREPPGWRAVGAMPPAVVYENPRALPRAFLVGNAVVLPGEEERLRRLAAPDFDGRRIVVLEEGPAGGETDVNGGSVAQGPSGPGFYEFSTECPADAWLVLSEAHFPGWTARVDGVEVPLLRADHLIQALRLPAGRHAVTFRYRSRYLGAGFVVGAAGLLVPLGILLTRRRRRVG
jgi:hypothetical protein